MNMTAIENLGSVEDAGAEISHFWGRGVCIKQTRIPAGAMLMQHQHHYPHLSYLVSGAVDLVTVNDERQSISAPHCLEIPAGVHHAVHALQDSVWLCIHGAAEEGDVDAVGVAPMDENQLRALAAKLTSGG